MTGLVFVILLVITLLGGLYIAIHFVYVFITEYYQVYKLMFVEEVKPFLNNRLPKFISIVKAAKLAIN